MMNRIIMFYLLVCSICWLPVGQAQNQQEIMIIGTMHQVPGIMKNAYRPMFKNALKYKPEAIYVEYQMKEDSVSIKNYSPKFYARADSLSKVTTFDKNQMLAILNKDLTAISKVEAAELAKYFYCQKDYANYKLYNRLANFGTSKNQSPTRNENGDLSIPLAIALNIKKLSAMDDQTYFYEYQQNWRACEKVSVKDGEKKYINKCLWQLNFQDVIGYLSFSSGKRNNHPKIFTTSHRLNSFEYREKKSEACDLGNYYWDYRNKKMAQNIATQVLASGHQRSLVVVGSGHLFGLLEAFARDYPELKVLSYHDFLKSK